MDENFGNPLVFHGDTEADFSLPKNENPSFHSVHGFFRQGLCSTRFRVRELPGRFLCEDCPGSGIFPPCWRCLMAGMPSENCQGGLLKLRVSILYKAATAGTAHGERATARAIKKRICKLLKLPCLQVVFQRLPKPIPEFECIRASCPAEGGGGAMRIRIQNQIRSRNSNSSSHSNSKSKSNSIAEAVWREGGGRGGNSNSNSNSWFS